MGGGEELIQDSTKSVEVLQFIRALKQPVGSEIGKFVHVLDYAIDADAYRSICNTPEIP